MKQVVVNIKNDKYSFFMELIKSFDFVQIQNTENTDSTDDVKTSLKQAVTELNLIKDGKLKGISTKELLDEL